jgi:hypothetical protein
LSPVCARPDRQATRKRWPAANLRAFERDGHLTHVPRRLAVLSICVLSLYCRLPADDPSNLQIRIGEGDGQTYAVGSRATRGITVTIADAAGNPVSGATVTFVLPESGPGGAFADGSKTEIVTTHDDGRASVWGMKWNRQAGSFEVRITATKGRVRAGTLSSQHLTEGTAPSSAKSGSSGGHKWLWIALGVGAAGAAVGIAARSHSSSSSCSSTVVLTQSPCLGTPSSGATLIGQPTIGLGAP